MKLSQETIDALDDVIRLLQEKSQELWEESKSESADKITKIGNSNGVLMATLVVQKYTLENS